MQTDRRDYCGSFDLPEYAPGDRDMGCRYVWVLPGGTLSVEPPGRRWLPVDTCQRGDRILVFCEHGEPGDRCSVGST